MVRVLQLSDTHFLEDGASPEGGFAYDTNAAFDAVHADAAARFAGDAQPALVVVTGDIADHGRPAQYEQAAAAFERFEPPVNACPGNHDLDATFTTGMGRTTIATSRVIETDDWCFLFADSNSGVMVAQGSGRFVDPNEEDRLHSNGCLGVREAEWIRDMCATTTKEHVFVWVHHPPSAPVGLTADADYAAEWEPLLADLPMIRGVGGGHTHVPMHYELAGRNVFVCPALKNNFDLVNKTLLPPGYRSYEFGADGSVSSELHLVDDDRWPRRPMARSVVALLNGELTYDEFNEILARRNA